MSTVTQPTPEAAPSAPAAVNKIEKKPVKFSNLLCMLNLVPRYLKKGGIEWN